VEQNMTGRFKSLACVAVLVVALTPTAARESDTAQKMRTAAAAFLKTLDAAQQPQATFTFDSEERLNWHFVPRERKGLPVKAMTPAQRTALAALLHTGLSDKGYEKVEKIRTLEYDLIVIEQGKNPMRDHDGYYLSVFGTPGADKPWGWRFEGHHVALNWTIIGGSAVASSPQFFGANPAEVRDGPRKGLRVLAGEEDLARTFVTSLDAAQSAEAVVSNEAPRDIITMNKLNIEPLESNGIVWTKLSAGQQKLLTRLIEEHAFGQVAAIGHARMEAIRKAGMDGVRIAWLGPTEKGAKHYYRVQGPTFLIEYDCTQGNGNHIHSVWRDFKGDFGADLLAEHYRRDHVSPALGDQ
jgi:hypothetical protein